MLFVVVCLVLYLPNTMNRCFDTKKAQVIKSCAKFCAWLHTANYPETQISYNAVNYFLHRTNCKLAPTRIESVAASLNTAHNVKTWVDLNNDELTRERSLLCRIVKKRPYRRQCYLMTPQENKNNWRLLHVFGLWWKTLLFFLIFSRK